MLASIFFQKETSLSIDKVKKQIFIDMENYQTHFMKNRTADDRIKQNKKPILHVYKLIRFI